PKSSVFGSVSLASKFGRVLKSRTASSVVVRSGLVATLSGRGVGGELTPVTVTLTVAVALTMLLLRCTALVPRNWSTPFDESRMEYWKLSTKLLPCGRDCRNGELVGS